MRFITNPNPSSMKLSVYLNFLFAKVFALPIRSWPPILIAIGWWIRQFGCHSSQTQLSVMNYVGVGGDSILWIVWIFFCRVSRLPKMRPKIIHKVLPLTSWHWGSCRASVFIKQIHLRLSWRQLVELIPRPSGWRPHRGENNFSNVLIVSLNENIHVDSWRFHQRKVSLHVCWWIIRMSHLSPWFMKRRLNITHLKLKPRYWSQHVCCVHSKFFSC